MVLHLLAEMDPCGGVGVGDLTANFSRSEFACKCGCGFDEMDLHLVADLQQLRDHFDKPVSVTSGCRCLAHNKSVGGAQNSQHLYGLAADIVVADVPPSDVADYADEVLEMRGVGRYRGWTHVDRRTGPKARWGSNS